MSMGNSLQFVCTWQSRKNFDNVELKMTFDTYMAASTCALEKLAAQNSSKSLAEMKPALFLNAFSVLFLVPRHLQ